MTTELPPLQTHSLYDTKWIPPKGGRFVGYEPKDEAWMRPLGLGRLTKTLKPLFDVRVEPGFELVGYTEHSPSAGRWNMEVCVVDRPARLAMWIDPREPYENVTVRRVQVNLQRCVVQGQWFMVWQCRPEDVVPLVEAKFIKVQGPDDIHRFEMRLYEKVMDHRYRR